MAGSISLRITDRPTIVRHFVLAALLVITVINYLQRNALNPAVTTIRDDLHLNTSDMGLIIGAFFLSYTLMQVPAGAFAQWLGPKWTLVLIATGWSLATAACGLAESFLDLYIARIVLGIFQAGIFSCATLILSVWYPASRRGIATAFLNSFMIIGGVIAAVLTGLLLEPLGWRRLFVLYALPGLAWAAWFAWWFRNRPQDHPGVNVAESQLIQGPVVAETMDTLLPPQDLDPPPLRSRRRSLPLLAILAITLLCAQQVCRAGANRLADTWMPTYLEESRGTSKQTAAFLTAWLGIAGVIGGMLGGVLSDKVLRRTSSLRAARNGVALVSLLGSVALYLASYPIQDVHLATAVFGLGVLVFTFSSPCAYAVTMDMGGKNLAIVFSLMNMAGNLGAWAFSSFVPHLVEIGGWDLALGVFIAMHLVAAASWLFLNPNADLRSHG